MAGTDAPVEDLLRELAPQVLGALVRRYRDFDAAEDAVQEALLAAAVHWPRDGMPDNPRSWLILTGSRRLIDSGGATALDETENPTRRRSGRPKSRIRTTRCSCSSCAATRP